jgi:Protein of unknown function (DUF2971)
MLNSLLSEKPPATLYHYTDQNGLLGIIKKKEILASHHQCLNDTQEFLHAKDIIRAEINRCCASANSESRALLERIRAALDGPGMEEVDLYVASFSEDGDSLPQWRAYGGQISGFALGFESERLVVPEEFRLARCIYDPKEQCEVAKAIVAEVEGKLAQIASVGAADKFNAWALLALTIHQFALIFKHEKFHDEREWRIFSPAPMMDVAPSFPVEEPECALDFRQGKSMLVPYRRVPLRENNGELPLCGVVVGPNPNKEQSRRSVQSLLNSQRGLAAVKARNSDIPFRNW